MIKDIILSQTSDNTYDWRFNDDDFLTGTGNSRLQSAVLHATLLKPYELIQELYNDKGCKAYQYTKDRLTTHVKALIEESLNESIKAIHEVQDVRTSIDTTGHTIKSSIIILKTDGTEVIVDGATI